MDKKKVKELIEQAIIWSKQANQYSVISNLEEALEELSKSDWVSVDDGLPPYCKNVLVIANGNRELVYVTSRVRNHVIYELDKNGFIKQFPYMQCNITHWKPIEKLEDL